VAEFGHSSCTVKGPSYAIYMDSWGDGPFVIEAGGKTFRFEDSDRFGPQLLTAKNEVRARPFPAMRSPFWRAHRIWVRQGRRTEEQDDHFRCLWDEPRPDVVRHMAGRYYMIVEHGEPDGKTVYLDNQQEGTDDH
jgi:hypothetical protein